MRSVLKDGGIIHPERQEKTSKDASDKIICVLSQQTWKLGELLSDWSSGLAPVQVFVDKEALYFFTLVWPAHFQGFRILCTIFGECFKVFGVDSGVDQVYWQLCDLYGRKRTTVKGNS
jgi:hypothetical protein